MRKYIFSAGDIKVSVEQYPDGLGGMRKILIGMKIPYAAPPLGQLRFKVGSATEFTFRKHCNQSKISRSRKKKEKPLISNEESYRGTLR